MHGQQNITFIIVTEKGCVFWKSYYYMRKANVRSSVVMVGMEGALTSVLQLHRYEQCTVAGTRRVSAIVSWLQGSSVF